MTINYIRDYITLNERKFFWINSSEDYSKKLDIQNIPKTNIPVVQYLGEGNKYINLELRTGGKTNSENSTQPEQEYISEKEWIRTFLGTRKGLKVKTVLPDAKSYDCVLLEGKITEDNSLLNIISFNVKLLIIPIIPPRNISNKNALLTQAQSARNTLKENIGENIPDTVFADKKDSIFSIMKRNGITFYKRGKDLFKKFSKGAKVVGDYTRKVQSKLNKLALIKSKIISFSQKPSQWVGDLLEINRKVRELANTPTQLFNIIVDTIGRAKVYFGDTKETLSGLLSAFDFTKSEPKTVNNLNTFYRNSDEEGIKNITNAALLITAYEMAANIDYSNSDDIKEVQESLSLMYNSIMANPLLDENTKNAIYLLKVEVDKFLNNLLKNVNNVIIVNISRPTPFDVIIFDRYGNLDLYDELIALNLGTITDLSNVSGDIKLYAEQI